MFIEVNGGGVSRQPWFWPCAVSPVSSGRDVRPHSSNRYFIMRSGNPPACRRWYF